MPFRGSNLLGGHAGLPQAPRGDGNVGLWGALPCSMAHSWITPSPARGRKQGGSQRSSRRGSRAGLPQAPRGDGNSGVQPYMVASLSWITPSPARGRKRGHGSRPPPFFAGWITPSPARGRKPKNPQANTHKASHCWITPSPARGRKPSHPGAGAGPKGTLDYPKPREGTETHQESFPIHMNVFPLDYPKPREGTETHSKQKLPS